MAKDKAASKTKTEKDSSERVPGAVLVTVITLGVLFLLSVWLVILAVPRFASEKPAGSGETEENGYETEDENAVHPYATSAHRDSYLCEISDTTQLIQTPINAQAAVLVDLGDYHALSSLHANDKIFPASLTKVMTLLVVCDRITDLDRTVTVTREMLDPLKGTGASVMSLSEGEIVPIRTLLYGLILKSGGDAAIVLADITAGSEESFVELMNRKAQQMGLSQTHFTNCTGLHDDNHYTTCREMAAIFAYALDNDLARTVLTTTECNMPSYYEKDISYYFKAGWYTNFLDYGLSLKLDNGLTVFGGKTGYTADTYDEQGKVQKNHCLVTCAKDGSGHTYVLVTAGGAGYPKDRAQDAVKVYTSYVK
ncbi:MAG: D-alanyl-D-alanine carboxypeptidase [Clostridia bacterium]|nr:D-alanyl-D-alanine carboxypeptidase [Clostridia bacterium]